MEFRKITNGTELARTPAREALLSIADAGLRAIDTAVAVAAGVSLSGDVLSIRDETIPLSDVRQLLVVGFGKCSLEAARALEFILGDRIAGGIVIDVHEGKLDRITSYTGDHPFPSERNVSATRELLSLLSGLTENDLVLALVSGGGSTLLCQPQEMQCTIEADVVRHLFRAGADIREMNILRKHLSLARGGHLARAAFPACVISLVFSDVPGDDLSSVASGPTVRDTTTIADAETILEKYKIREQCPVPRSALIETPKEDRYFKRVHNILFVSNVTALSAMREAAEERGLHAEIRTALLSGEARDVGLNIIREAHAAPPGTVLLYGGETTVTVRKPGKGGRNQECAISALREIAAGDTVLALASDGRDNTDSAGAICDIMTKRKAETLGLDPVHFLEENDTYSFFSRAGDLLQTGDTGSNVSDLILAFHE